MRNFFLFLVVGIAAVPFFVCCSWQSKFTQLIANNRSMLIKKLGYDPAIEVIPCRTRSRDVTICCHGYGGNKTIARNIAYRTPLSGHLITFNFPDHDPTQSTDPHTVAFGSIREILPLLYIIKLAIDSGLKKINLYGFSAGGGALINALVALNTNRWDSDLLKLNIGAQEKKAMIQAIENGNVILDCPLKSFQEILDLKGSVYNLQVIAQKYKQNDMQPIDSVSRLAGMRLNILLHFQHNDEILSNRDDELFIRRLKQANKNGKTRVAMGSDGGHNVYHASLWKAYRSLGG